MARLRKTPSLKWSEIGVLAMLGGLFPFGLVAKGRTLQESLESIGFLAAVLLLAWLWQLTLRQAPALTRWQLAWNGAAFVAGWRRWRRWRGGTRVTAPSAPGSSCRRQTPGFCPKTRLMTPTSPSNRHTTPAATP